MLWRRHVCLIPVRSGDWCTAGLLAKLAAGGQERMRGAGAEGVREALRYGQALAAWNCAFEGARGGIMRSIELRSTGDHRFAGRAAKSTCR